MTASTPRGIHAPVLLAAWVLPALGWIAGCAAQLQMAALWPPDAVAVLLLAGAGLLALARLAWRRGWPRGAVVLAVASALLLGFGLTHQRSQARLDDRLPAALEGVDLVLTGTVDALPRESLDGTRFVFAVDAATRDGRPVRVPERVSLGWYRGVDDEALLGGPMEPVRAGQRWRLTVRLKQPHGGMNPHGFDLELWLFERGIGATGSVRSKPGDEARRLEDRAGAFIERARQDWRDAIQARVADPGAAGVLAALAIGDQAAIDREGWDLFRITGVAHLLSISGLHVTMFAWLAGWLIGRAWRWAPGLMHACPAPVAARWGGLAAAAGYALLAGWGVPVQRTVWMIGAVVLLRQAGLRWPLPAVLLAAMGVVTALDPWALLQPGFWLSFVAVGLLVVSEPVRGQRLEAIGWHAQALAMLRGGLRTQAVATVGLAPLSLMFFQQISLVGFAANLVAIPAVTLLITPLALLGLLLPPLWALAAGLVQALSVYLQWLADAPWAVWHAAAAPPWAVTAGLLAAGVAVLPLPWRLRVLSVPLMLPLLAPPVDRPVPGHVEVVAADIGQGTAVLVRTANHLLVYDTGPQYTRDADAGSRVLLPLLRARGERQIDLLMLSHRDTDHVGGAAALLQALPVRGMSSSLTDDHPLRRTPGVPQQRCDAGQSWNWDGVRFTVLHPRAEEHATLARPNALSCVLKVEAAGGSLLLTGDLEAGQEASLIQRDPAALRADVLTVPHHGSRTSSTGPFLDAVAPRVAVVQAGYRSRYGHPAPDVMTRYAQRGIAIVRNDHCGAWTWTDAPSKDAAPACTRDAVRRYWHWRQSRP